MCGICGKYDPAGVEPAEVAAMMAAIAHRGPDDEGHYVNDHIGLGSRRLSIIDLANGHQPIPNEDRSIWVVFNGEIYNHPELREELRQKGHAFRTNSDTEVIVHLYEEFGERCVEHLRGMFAIAIWDEQEQKLVLIRDHLGQKPLFYAQERGTLLFASEVKAILAVCRQQPEIDYESVHQYLSLRFIPSPQTMFRQIRKLPPAHILVFQNGRVTTSRYWDLAFHEKLNLSEMAFIDGLREKLSEVVEAHLISDVPVGAFLSGGMDSSMIVAFMAQSLDRSFRTFAIGVDEQDFNELPYARMVADEYETIHVEACVQSNVVQLLPEMIWHMDEPSDPIAACQYHAAALAAKDVKVVLGGDGGDELFAGFDRYIGIGYVDHYARIPGFIRRNIIGALLEQIPENFAYKSASQKVRWLQQLSMLPTSGERYAEATCFFRFNHGQKQALYGDELARKVGHINSSDVIVRYFDGAPADDPIDRMLYTDYHTRLPEHSLMLTDRMTMAHGLELRSPFLDHELVTYLTAFPRRLKVHRGELKYILRQLGRDYLPPEIVERDKHGFMFPVAYWFRHGLYSFVKEYLLMSPFVTEGLFREETVLKLIEDHRHNRVDNHVRLWMLLNLAIWQQIFIEGESPDDVREELMRHM